MNPFTALGRALIGWLDLLAARPEAEGKFDQTRRGLLTACAWYAAAVLVTLVAQAFVLGRLPGAVETVYGLIVNAVSLAALWLVILVTGLLQPKADARAMQIAATYALAFILVVGLPLLMTGSQFSGAILGALGFMLYRLGRQVGGLGIGWALLFLAVGVAVLVAVPVGLYMLATQGQGIG